MMMVIVLICCEISYNKGPSECSACLRASVLYNRKLLQLHLSKSINGESSTHTNNYIEFGKKMPLKLLTLNLHRAFLFCLQHVKY